MSCGGLKFHAGKAETTMKKTYTIEVAGLKRDLQLFPVADNLYIAAFIMFGDVELTQKCAEHMIKIAPEHDIIITAESKSIPLVHEMVRQQGRNNYIVARKAPKVYMENIITTDVNSITTKKLQSLCIGQNEMDAMRGKRVLIVDDVISTGGSLASIEYLVEQSGGTVVGRMAALAEGDAADRDDIIYLKKLPLFDKDGNTLA